MKKYMAALLIILFLLPGCGVNSNNSPIPKDAVESPSGKMAVCSDVQLDLADEEGLIYSIFDVQLYDTKENRMICTFHIVGDNFQFLWSGDSKFVSAGYQGRMWSAFSVMDIKSHSCFTGPDMDDIVKYLEDEGEALGYVIKRDRPDPYVKPIEWSPDSRKLLVSYAWTDTDDKTQSGIFVYDIYDNTISALRRYLPSDEYNPEIKKPVDFIWDTQ